MPGILIHFRRPRSLKCYRSRIPPDAIRIAADGAGWNTAAWRILAGPRRSSDESRIPPEVPAGFLAPLAASPMHHHPVLERATYWPRASAPCRETDLGLNGPASITSLGPSVYPCSDERLHCITQHKLLTMSLSKNLISRVAAKQVCRVSLQIIWPQS
jgi:hypothetical protein